MINKWINDHALDSISVSDDELKRTVLGVWTTNERQADLTDALTEYYKNSESVSNSDSMSMWKEFKHWANCSGYTVEEINKAKRNNQFRLKSEMRK